MKHNFTYYTVSEERGTCGMQVDRLVTGDGKCDHGVGFDSLRGAKAFIFEIARRKDGNPTIRNINLQSLGSEFKYLLTYEIQNSADTTRWMPVKKTFTINAEHFGLFTAGEVAARHIVGY